MDGVAPAPRGLLDGPGWDGGPESGRRSLHLPLRDGLREKGRSASMELAPMGPNPCWQLAYAQPHSGFCTVVQIPKEVSLPGTKRMWACD